MPALGIEFTDEEFEELRAAAGRARRLHPSSSEGMPVFTRGGNPIQSPAASAPQYRFESSTTVPRSVRALLVFDVVCVDVQNDQGRMIVLVLVESSDSWQTPSGVHLMSALGSAIRASRSATPRTWKRTLERADLESQQVKTPHQASRDARPSSAGRDRENDGALGRHLGGAPLVLPPPDADSHRLDQEQSGTHGVLVRAATTTAQRCNAFGTQMH
jgi:hypothetical protein